MGFMKPAKIINSAPLPEPPAMAEPAVRVEKIEDKSISDYNAMSRRRKGILSTILAGKGKEGSGDPVQPEDGGESRPSLRKTLG